MQASIIIPTLNRAVHLKRTLESLFNLDFDSGEFEIIVVDNGSTDNTKEVTYKFIEGNPAHSLKYICDSEPGMLTGRHRGASEAKSEILTFIDDDIKADKGWLTAILDTFSDKDVHLVGGPNLPEYETDPPSWLSWFWIDHPNGKWCGWLSLLDFGEKFSLIDANFIWGLNFSIRKKSLYELGGFHPDCIPQYLQHFQGDGETGLTMKAMEKGYKAVYQPKALVYHFIPTEKMTLEYFKKRAFYQGVCNSYTEIRKTGKIQTIEHTVNDNNNKFNIRNIIGALKHDLYLFFIKGKNPFPRYKYEYIKAKTKKSYFNGYIFHRNAVIHNPELINWITKENYFNYQLPELTIK